MRGSLLGTITYSGVQGSVPLRHFFLTLSLNSQEVLKNSTESHVFFTQVLLMVTSYLATAHYENQEIDVSPLLFSTLWTSLSFL